MTREEIVSILDELGAILTGGHFVYTSGRHGNTYVNKDALYPHTEKIQKLCAEMARPFIGKGIDSHGQTRGNLPSEHSEREGGTQQALPVGGATRAPVIETVVGPTVGGVILSQWVAHELSICQKGQVFGCFAEERAAADGSRERYFGRGYDNFVRGRRVLVVEDILTTGGSVKQVVAAVRACGGEVVAVRAICNRGGVTSADVGDAPLGALLDVTLESWGPESCPLCKQNVPINTTVGKGGKR